uniref:Uncharacterized protein n=1 Tax=Corethron hystrix TaxID=216773 RepID=A0A7S1BGB9_9STRA|mmetsp:Transcript_25091/g.57994  ORF Transcript_25091/g.57994 Transcript_25091/m.57994 type:complete len:149 (+) Transcript_25091:193-639(+)
MISVKTGLETDPASPAPRDDGDLEAPVPSPNGIDANDDGDGDGDTTKICGCIPFNKSEVSCGCVINRAAMVVIGIVVAFVLLIPNAMMGTSEDKLVGVYLGLAASWFFGLGGILGAIVGGKWGWLITLVPGIVLQIAAFAAWGFLGSE